MRLFAELRRRNVLRAVVLYIGAVWALAQGISQLSPAAGLPEWATRWFLIAAAVGFPFWLAFAWFYEWTPQGLKRESEIAAADASIAHSTGRKLDFAIIGVLAAAVVLLLTDRLVVRKSDVAAAVPGKSVAVLPFENLSADKDNEYFVAGMQDLILTKLADIGELKVISRTSTLKYRSHPENLKQVGAELGVAHVLEGSVQRQGNAVLINVQLIHAATDAHLWADSYQRTLDNVFGVEGEVAGKVADALKAKLSPLAATRLATSLSNDSAADDLYLRAEYFSHRGDIDFDTAQYKRAIDLYRQAIDKAPGFALALARLSYTDNALAWLGGGGEDVAQLGADAQARAEAALQLMPNLPEARLAMGYSHYWGRGEYPAALADFAAVLELRPNDAKALLARGLVLRRQGHFDAGIDALTRAQTLDPRNSELSLALGETLMMAARYPDAEAALQRALALDPANLQARFRLSWEILVSRGDVAGALQAARGDEPRIRLLRAYLLALQRNFRQALEVLDTVPDTPDTFYQSTGGPKPLQQAVLYELLGDTTRARNLYAQSLPLVREQLATAGGIPLRAVPVWVLVAQAEFGGGDRDKALAALTKAQALFGQVQDYADGPYLMVLTAAGYAKAGRADVAVPLLEKGLATPGVGVNYSPAMLPVDLAWDPIRSDPGFQALLKRYAGAQPQGHVVGTAPD